jgi:hypothetical protein
VLEGWCEVHVIALSASGQPLTGLKATQLALWEKNDLILDYEVRPVLEKEPLSIAFAVPRNTEPAGMPGPYERALDSCLQLKRKVDGWMMLQCCRSEDGPERASLTQEESAADLRFLLDTAVAEKSFKARKSRLSCSRSLLHALLSLIPAMSRGRGRRHLIFLDDGSCRHPDPAGAEAIVGAAKNAEITLHGVSLRQTSWHDVCAATGGQWLVGATDEAVREPLTGLYACLAASYQVRYRSDEFRDLRIEVCTDQGLGEVTLAVY